MNEEVTLDLQEILNVLKKKKDDFNNNSIIWNNIRSLKLFIIPPIYEIKASVVIGKTLDEKMKIKMIIMML
ncbi:hypothetical protein JTS98_08460 [Clostridium botulinum]|nr:hypothetical protein [Clostridium botulinum]